MGNRGNVTKFQNEESDTNASHWQIYTDWANHYLDKIKSKRRIQDLAVDVTDGVVLADVIEAVSKSITVFFLTKSYWWL